MRAGWHEYFMGMAHQAATRATCPRKHVGAVIVRDRTVLSTGYNGSIRGMAHCEDIGCMMEDGHCVATVKEAVGGLAGVDQVDADADTKRVEVAFDPSRVSLAQIQATLDEAGYPVQK